MKSHAPIQFVFSEYYGTEDPRDGITFRALIRWPERENEPAHSFSAEELEVHISACRARNDPTEQLERALARLRRMNGRD